MFNTVPVAALRPRPYARRPTIVGLTSAHLISPTQPNLISSSSLFSQRLADLQRALEELGAKVHEAEQNRLKWTPLPEVTVEMVAQQMDSLRAFNHIHVAPVARDSVSVNELAARLTGRNVPLSHSNLKSLEEITTRVRLLQLSVDERARDLERIVQEHGSEQQDFLTKAVEEPWERAVTSNKLPCYIK